MVELANTIWADGPSSDPQEPDKAKIREWGTWVEQNLATDIANDAIVILATGQSNIDNYPAYSWVPPANLFVWNGTYLSPGTVFTPPSGTLMRLSYSFGAEIAKANPTRQVYVINIGKGSEEIAQWMAGAAAPDMYAACKAAVEAALASIGVSKIDHLLWWQGESDYMAGRTTYVDDWQTVWFRFLGDIWFPRETPVTIMALSDSYLLDLNMRSFNNTLRQVVDLEPQFRTFVDTRPLAASLWDTNRLHMTGAGYDAAGKMAYRAAFAGAGVGRNATKWQTVFKVSSTVRQSTTTLANDPELQFSLRASRSYRIRGSIWCQAPDSADFKFGFTGPSAVIVDSVLRVAAGDTPTAETITTTLGVSYPTGRTILQSMEQHSRIEFDFFIATTAAAGIFALQWAQNASVATATRVFAGSYMEVLEV